MANEAPFRSVEVRWFLPGGLASNARLGDWFEGPLPFPRDPDAAAPRWQGRSDGRPDVYLELPGMEDMGIKLREGLLQIKGRVADLGPVGFGGSHAGTVECWSKWSYPDLPAPFGLLFEAEAPGRVTIPVDKTRARRLFTAAGAAAFRESPPDTVVERGVVAELAELTVAGTPFVSLAFEAFPDDEPMRADFAGLVSRCLANCEDGRLDASRSQSYPRLLDRLTSSPPPR